MKEFSHRKYSFSGNPSENLEGVIGMFYTLYKHYNTLWTKDFHLLEI